MARLKKGTKKKLEGTIVIVEKELENGLVLVNINGAYRVVRRSNLK